MNNSKCILKTSEEVTEKKESKVVRYAWGNERLKTWFITKNKKSFLPKGSRLLYKLDCKYSHNPIKLKSTYPNVGDIINDIDDNKLEIIKVNYI